MSWIECMWKFARPPDDVMCSVRFLSGVWWTHRQVRRGFDFYSIRSSFSSLRSSLLGVPRFPGKLLQSALYQRWPLDFLEPPATDILSCVQSTVVYVSLKHALRWVHPSTMYTKYSICMHDILVSSRPKPQDRLGVNQPGHHPVGAAVAGAAATVFHDAVMTPMDVVKQRLQLGYHKGMLDCMLTIRRTEGTQVRACVCACASERTRLCACLSFSINRAVTPS